MAAKDLILKIVELDEKIAALKNEFDSLAPGDQEKALDEYFNGELKKIGEDDHISVGAVRAAELLLSTGGNEAAAILGRGLAHSNPDVRMVCQDALAHLAEEDLSVVMPLVDEALKKGGVMAEELPFLLAEIDNPEVPPTLERFLSHKEASVVASAIEALADYGDPSSAPAIEKLLKDKRSVTALNGNDKEVECTIGQLAEDAMEILSGEED